MKSTYLMWLVILIIMCVYLPARRARTAAAAKMVLKKHRKKTKEEIFQMVEMIKEYEGKYVMLNFMNGNEPVIGKISVPDNCGSWVKLEREDGTAEAVNLEYITRVRECPLDKKGKPKSVWA